MADMGKSKKKKKKEKMDLMQYTFARVTVLVLAVISKELGITPSSGFNSLKEGTQKSKIVFTGDWGEKAVQVSLLIPF